MLSLRTRFTLLLVAAVVLVLFIATFVTAQFMRKIPDELYARAVAEKAELVVALLKADPAASAGLGVEFGVQPIDQDIDQRLTARLKRALSEKNQAMGLIVLAREAEGGSRRLAFALANGRWVTFGFPGDHDFPVLPLITYLGLVAAGLIAIALYASAVMMRPLRVLDEAIGLIRPDGNIPALPETGPPEMRTTARTINRLSARLNAAIGSRMRLVAAAGHDMRTPMTRMRLRAEFIADVDEREAWLKDLTELDHMADSAIRLVREEVSGASGETVALDRLLADIVTEVRETGLPVETGTLSPATVLGGTFALKRALRNLVVNAATHGQGARVSLAPAGAGQVEVTITDRGPGIPPHLIDQVFEPFFRADQARRQAVPGAGLGLAISREIIETHAGSVTIANRPGGGLLQAVRFPAVQPG